MDQNVVLVEIPKDESGRPMVGIQCAASETVPVIGGGSVQVGPVVVTRWVKEGTDEEIVEQGRRVQRITEVIVGAERRLVQHAKGEGPVPT